MKAMTADVGVGPIAGSAPAALLYRHALEDKT
jgi:hypothetical protein